MFRSFTAAILVTVASSALALAAEKTYQLPEETAAFKDAPGVESVQANCTACHSSDYIATQPSHKGKEFWTAEVKKMKKVYGAPIEDKDIDAIVAYLANTY